MKNEIPAMIDTTSMTFTRLGEYEDIDMTLTSDGRMTFERVYYNEEAGDWDGNEVYASDIEDQMSEYAFLHISSKPLTFGQLMSSFSHKMFAR